MFKSLENHFKKVLRELTFKESETYTIDCQESFIISHYIDKFVSQKKALDNSARFVLIAKSRELLKDIAYDVSKKDVKCAFVSKKTDIRYIFEPSFELLLIAYDDLDAPFAKIDDTSKSQFEIKKGKDLDISALADFLQSAGYWPTSCVQNEGEFCQRGEVVDLFIINSKNPIRIYLDFDCVENIKEFDPSSQLAGKDNSEFDSITLTSFSESSITQTCPLRDYLHPFSVIFADFKECDEINAQLIFMPMSSDDNSDDNNIAIQSSAAECFKGNIELFVMKLKLLISQGIKVYISVDSDIEESRIRALLTSHDSQIITLENKNLFIGQMPISKGFYIKNELAVFTYSEIFLKKKNRTNNAFARLETQAIESFLMLKPGDLVVHADWGVGKFVMLDRLVVRGSERDYIKIEFANEEFYYVPLERANLVQKYIGKENVTLDSLHSKAWKNRKAKALENAKLFADKLLKLYALRHQKAGYSYSEDTAWGVKFESLFEYDETEDQLKAIEDVKKDMQSPTPMDRIICGDVGFGKTEVAFRAAFKAIMDGKQVCFLSPTTILTNQHFNNFISRASSFPITVKMFSRMVGAKEARECIRGLENGNVDIVFATHKILRSPVKFKNLGLLIIDEEQRFGVGDKEKIKSLKVNIDTLTLTATPIPRTLYMSMLNLRSMSLLKTPPALRLSVKVVVDTFDFEKAKEAIKRELERGGQVYYLHNNTEDIEMVRSFIQESFKDAKVDAVSGQHDSKKIEDSIYSFATGYTDILVCTTIIENGIDVPNANTLIVDDATIYGTSQLYQIKGRVGRGKNQAYAYLFIPKSKENISSAMQRIKVIAQNSTLGSGFNIAMGDLMLRGSGNILGKEQAGYVEEVGLDMYMHLLDISIKELELERENKIIADKKIALDENDEVIININYTAYIPDDYINQVEVKFDIYKKIANAKSESELEIIMENVKNRFGNPPEVFKNLYTLSLLKINMRRAGISELVEKEKIISAKVEYMRLLNIDKALELIKKSKGKVSLDAKRPNYLFFDLSSTSPEQRLSELSEKIKCLV